MSRKVIIVFNNQSTELSSSSEINKIIQQGEVISKENPKVGLPGVSRLINSAISKRQEDQRKQSFLEKKLLHKRENEFTMKTQNHMMDRAMKQSTRQFHKKFAHISKCVAYNAEKKLQLRMTKQNEYS